MTNGNPRWVVLTWRLPSPSSPPRVTTWRTLRRLGAVLLTPGAAIVPFTDDVLEQCESLAQRSRGGGRRRRPPERGSAHPEKRSTGPCAGRARHWRSRPGARRPGESCAHLI